MYGGLATNPIHVLTRILAGLHDQGRVTLPGFYDGVPELPDATRAQWQGLAFDHAKFLGDVDLSVPASEPDRTPLEMIWSRPTAEVNGIRGGYTGDGFKTVLPSEAHAKVSFRLVGRQDPDAVLASFRSFVEAALPADCEVIFHGMSGSCAGHMSVDTPAFDQARAALTEEWGRPAAFVGCGGSIPIAGFFRTVLGMDALLTGFGKDDDLIHSPNEKYDVESFRKGIRSWARILDRLGS
jgi:acetylornithine deacetylase/succinyl-diaminopimelate desuccinylase-like protein